MTREESSAVSFINKKARPKVDELFLFADSSCNEVAFSTHSSILTPHCFPSLVHLMASLAIRRGRQRCDAFFIALDDQVTRRN